MKAGLNALDTLKNNRTRILRLCIIAFFVVIFVIGVCISDDYTEFGDAAAQRRHGLVNYQYLNQKLFGRTVEEIDAVGLPALDEYVSKQYGVFLQLPLIMIEDMSGFTMSMHDVNIMRNVYTFAFYFAALIALFFLMKELFKSELLSLVGVAIMYLFPQFFEASVVNIKDMMFISMCVFACFFLVKMLKNGRKLKYCIPFALFGALATGARIIGAFIIVGAVVFMLFEDMAAWRTKDGAVRAELGIEKQSILKKLLPYIVVIIGSVGFYILTMPACWSGIGDFIKTVTSKAMDYEAWDNTMPFMGQNVTWEQTPWYYLPVMMGLTIPLFDIAMFAAGIIFLVIGVIKKGRWLRFIQNRYIWLFAALFFVPFLYQILAHVKIYLGWRHMYILFIPLCIIAVYGIKTLHEKLSGKKKAICKAIVPVITAAALTVSAVRIAIDHPFQLSMYNLAGISVADQNYRNGRLAYLQCYEYLLEKYPNTPLIFEALPYIDGIDPEQQKWFGYPNEEREADFYIETYRDIIGNEATVQGFSEIYSIWIDGYKIASVFQRNGAEL